MCSLKHLCHFIFYILLVVTNQKKKDAATEWISCAKLLHASVDTCNRSYWLAVDVHREISQSTRRAAQAEM